MHGRGIEFSELSAQLDRTEHYLRTAGYRGYDPYDALKSPIARLPVVRDSHTLRWGFQQVLKRVPIQTRPLLGIPKGYNPVTLGLALQGMSERDQALEPASRSRAEEVARLTGELERMVSPGFSGACWGYDFDWESRFTSIPAGHPTVVATGFITNALYHAWKVYGDQKAKDLCISAASFVLEDLNRTMFESGFCWSYSPTDRQVVLNATMKGARLLAQASELANADLGLDLARQTVQYVASQQRSDGCWPYSIGDGRDWADHFHTCYILDCLDEFLRIAPDSALRNTLVRGIDYYLANFFTHDGAPKYYDKCPYPFDSSSCGQALLSLCRFEKWTEARMVAHWAVQHLALADGEYKYQIHRHFENRIPYMRWSTAWMYLGLAAVERCFRSERTGDRID